MSDEAPTTYLYKTGEHSMKDLYLIPFFLLLLVGCSSEQLVPQPAARRTVLIYLAGDNNLSGEVAEKIERITSGWHNRQDNLLIYQDSKDESNPPSLLQVVGDAAHPSCRVVRVYPEGNSASTEVFGQVIKEVLTDFPANDYGLVIFSHGTGWLPEGLYSQPRSEENASRSVLNDNGSEMEITDFASLIPDHRFQFIVFEACLMAGVEVAYELRNKADYLVASSAEILSPGFTSIYPSVINDLFVQPVADLTGLACRYYAYCNSREGQHRSGTVSVIRLDRMETLACVMQPVSALQVAVDTDNIQCFDRSSNRLFFDLGDYVRYKTTAAATQTAAGLLEQVYAALTEVVVYEASTPFFVDLPIRSHSGLTVYIQQPDYPALNTAYQQLAWYKKQTEQIK